jgi:SAM-dependent methyltransferase
MILRARENARVGGYENVEFRLGEIEQLPVSDDSVDVVISNCVINLSPQKARVFDEAYRVLKPGGRLMISDIVLLKELPKAVKDSIEAYVGCVAGAMLKDDYLKTIEAAGFGGVTIHDESVFPTEFVVHDPTVKAMVEGMGLSDEEVHDHAHSVVSVKVSAVK